MNFKLIYVNYLQGCSINQGWKVYKRRCELPLVGHGLSRQGYGNFSLSHLLCAWTGFPAVQPCTRAQASISQCFTWHSHVLCLIGPSSSTPVSFALGYCSKIRLCFRWESHIIHTKRLLMFLGYNENIFHLLITFAPIFICIYEGKERKLDKNIVNKLGWS